MTDTYRDHPLRTALAAAAQARPSRLAIPVTCLTIWHVVRRIRNRIMHQAGATAEGEATR